MEIQSLFRKGKKDKSAIPKVLPGQMASSFRVDSLYLSGRADSRIYKLELCRAWFRSMAIS